ncbi:hypothetical protein M2271_006078 [Streptomyces sp. LBL]|nr:hypothetical protein [Streptomyces sp. LBL]
MLSREQPQGGGRLDDDHCPEFAMGRAAELISAGVKT